MLDAVTGNLERYMDLLSARQKLVASNIANADTPGYKTQDIDFQFEFMSSGQRASSRRPSSRTGLAEKPDGNNVNMDREARMLAENADAFQSGFHFGHGPVQNGTGSHSEEGRSS